ncbi:MAG: efflux RND transporter periplasmic adaptor subunit [Candidatus Eremiobacteraeota bacterium]|nr:efflux RND transporter periplasmic adaptor subunit [Candidatus Eremiobacteraeota bacterium]
MKRAWILIVCLLLGGGAAWWRWQKSGSRPASTASPLAVPENAAGKAGDVAINAEAMKLAEIQVAPARLRSVEDRLTVSGSIQSGGDQLAKVTPKVAGKVIQLLVQPGDSVAPGQTLAILESAELAQVQADYKAALAESRAQHSNLARQRQLAKLGQFARPPLEETRTRAVEDERSLHQARHHLEEERAGLRQAQAEREVMRAKVNRNQDLQELVSRQDRERDQADLEKAEADLAGALARVHGAEGDLRLAQKQSAITQSSLSREEKVYSGQYLTSRELVEAQAAAEMARVRLESAADRVKLMGGLPGRGNRILLVSPIRGRVQDVSVTLGETVPVDKAACTVINLDKVWARLALAPKDAGKAALGDALELHSEAAPGHVFRGRVSAIDAGSDETTRAVYLRVPLNNPQGLLKTGTYVQGSLITAVRQQKLTVPDEAIQEHNGRPTLYVSLHGGQFEVRHVLLGSKGKQWREVSEGLKPGEKIATHGTFYLKSEALKSSLSDGCCAGE